jgi:hypothetical protein
MFWVANANSGVITGCNAATSAFVAPQEGLYVFSFSDAGNSMSGEVTPVIDDDTSSIYICTLWFDGNPSSQ